MTRAFSTPKDHVMRILAEIKSKEAETARLKAEAAKADALNGHPLAGLHAMMYPAKPETPQGDTFAAADIAAAIVALEEAARDLHALLIAQNGEDSK